MTKSDWISLAGLIVAIIGFAATISQLVRTAKASEATKVAVERTERRMAMNHLLVLIPQFRILETDLDSAADENDRRLAIRALVAYSHIASEVAGLLRNQDSVDDVLVDRLALSARNASMAKANLINNPKQPAKSVTRDFRSELADVSMYLGTLVGQFKISS